MPAPTAGVLVVSRPLPELQNLPDFIYLAEESPEAFAGAIELALSRRREQQASQAMSWAHDYTWNRIAEREILPVLRATFGI